MATTRSSAKSLYYRPLDSNRQEIRLLKVLSQPDNKTVRCRLATFSLEDLSAKSYRHHEEQRDTDNVTAGGPLTDPKLRAGWIDRTSLTSFAPLKRVDTQQPFAELHRFTWGDFASLSYVWGSQSSGRTIIVNGQQVKVTSNLEHALRQFRREGLFSGRFMLWVDALCINQNDLGERAIEVQRMKEIYGLAWTVIAWLGEATADSDAGIQLVQYLAACRDAGCERELPTILRNDPKFLGGTCWFGLHEIVNREYWTRLWIIQELVMGGARVRIKCGTSTVEWRIFCQGIAVLKEHLWLVKDLCLRQDTSGKARRYWLTRSLHLIHQDLSVLSLTPLGDTPKIAFGRLLDLANSVKCSEPKDKVYALLGLVPDVVARLLHPDYSISTAMVYTRTAQAFILAYGNLDPLREGNPWGPTGCPSWVADWLWSSRVRNSRVEQPVWGPAYLFPPRDEPEVFLPYTASGDRSPGVTFSDDGLRLTCTGFIVDRISGLSAAEAGYFDWDRSSMVYPTSWQSAYGDNEATAEALVRTLVSDRVRFGQKPGRRHHAILHLPSTFKIGGSQFEQRGWSWLAGHKGYYFRWELFRKAIDDFPLGPCKFGDYFDDVIPADGSEYDYTEVYACAERSAKRSRFMTTENGFMGWAPGDMYHSSENHVKVGDMIAIVMGCSTPLVIRPVNDAFQIFGEAFVQGLMDGEAMRGLSNGQYKLENLTFI